VTDFTTKKLFKYTITVFVIAALFTQACKSRPGETATKQTAAAVINSACDKILADDFEGAGDIISDSQVTSNKAIEQLNEIVQQYGSIKAARKKGNKTTYKKHIDELDDILKKDIPSEPNELGKAFAALIQARDHAEKQRKDTLLQEPYVKKLTEKAIYAADKFRKEGNWVDAYAYGYYWLQKLNEDNKDYKKESDLLTEMALIELDLMDNSCETAAERHKGIKPEMFIQAIRMLDFNYVDILDYTELTENAINRCRLLGEVLAGSKKKLAYRIDTEKVHQWTEGLAEIERDTGKIAGQVTKSGLARIFEEVLILNEATLGLPEEVIVSQFTEATLKGLDPYTSLVWPWQITDFQKNMTQEFTGIGVEISKPTGKLTIGGLLPDAPAYNTTSIDAGDVIEAIDGEPVTKDMSLNCAISKITGPRGTKVVLTIRHEGSKETEDITIVRDKIVVPTVKGWLRTSDGKWRYFLDESNGLGYLRITNFTATTAPDMETILIGLERKGLNGLIIDLRFNTGGYLETAAAIVDMFIESGPIVKSRQRWSVSSNQERAHSTGTHPNYPVVVLINGISASASEIVAGALQDKRYKRATLVGSRTYGKGSVQVITPATGSGSQLKYTTAHYHLPSEQRVRNRYVMEKVGSKDWGIAPDVKIKLTGSEMQKMIDTRRDNETLARAGTNNKADSKRHTAEETINSDPQVAVGLLVLKTKMIQSGKLLQPQTANSAVAATKTDSKL